MMMMIGINSMALPPLIASGPAWMQQEVVKPVVQGDASCCLALTEPWAGSDVAGIRMTAELQPDGRFYLCNGLKKYITGGASPGRTWLTTAVRTGGAGGSGVSLLLIDRDAPGVSVRKLKTQFDSSHSTTFIRFTDVLVPRRNLIGKEGTGFLQIMANFNHERFVIAVSAARCSRVCYTEAFEFATQRKAFGKALIQQPVIRNTLGSMARRIEALQDFVERIAFQFSCGVPDRALGAQCALLKVQATECYSYCATEAAAGVFGGAGLLREGKGRVVERLYRDVLAVRVPGGSQEILLDLAMRTVAKKLQTKSTKKTRSKL
jgi:alkylation response protein AidB-like acyl-CoA dehydrogenase